jgi:hypothetical protein
MTQASPAAHGKKVTGSKKLDWQQTWSGSMH